MADAGRNFLLFFLAGLAGLAPLAGLAGCLPTGRNDPAGVGAAAPVVSAQPQRGLALYRQYRPEAPEVLTVFPKERPDNTFGEFNDELHDSRGRQEALPALPGGDVMAMAGPGGGRQGAYGQETYPMPPAEVMGGGAGRSRVAAGGQAAGLTAGDKNFYPLEQLVYGGEYPDIDKPDSYRLMPRDVVSVTVRDHPEFSGKVEIQADGTVRLPNAPDFIRLRGLTPDEAADELRRVLGVYVRGECTVRVQTNRARGGYYFVLGDVLQPGRFPMGLEEVKLSDAVLAANWEANPARLDADGDELGPSFPAASPRGKFVAPPSADLARVVLITPHRSSPARTVHDIRSAMLGVTANDPVVRPGQIVVVPSLSAEKNRSLGLSEVAGFSTGASPARLPAAFPDNGRADYAPIDAPEPSAAERNMTSAFDANQNGAESGGYEEAIYESSGEEVIREGVVREGAARGAAVRRVRTITAQELTSRELPPWEEPPRWEGEAPPRWAGMGRASAARREVGRAGTAGRAPARRTTGGFLGGLFGGRAPAARAEPAADGSWEKGF